MNNKVFNSFILVICGVLFWLIVADINGKWSGYVDYNGTDIPLTYTFKVEGDKLTGTSQTPLGTSEITEGKIDKDHISFKINLGGTMVSHTGKVFADSINLTINYQGADLMTVLKRSKSN